MNVNKARNHAIRQIRSTAFHHEPYTHLVVDNLFPDWYYNLMLENFPQWGEMYQATDYSKQLDLVLDPGVVEFADGAAKYDRYLRDPKLLFWDAFKATFFADKFKNALLAKFDGQVTGDTGSSYLVGRLAIERAGAGLGPHRDRIDKQISIVIYVDDRYGPVKAKNCGTDVLTKRGDFTADDRHYSFDDFDVHHTIEYKPNRMVAWATSRDPARGESFHAYRVEGSQDRRTLKMFVLQDMPVEVVREHIASTKQYANDWRNQEELENDEYGTTEES